MNIKIIAISIVAIVGFLFVSYSAFNKPETVTFDGVSELRTPEQASASGTLMDRAKGSGPNVMVEYSDLQCPACKSFHEYIEQEKTNDAEFARLMNEEYTVVFRHFPLVSIHRNAQLAAQAAEAAGAQDAFFPFIDSAFARQQEWGNSEAARDIFIEIAQELELNVEQFTTDIDSPAVKAKVESDLSTALSMGLNSTPTFFINDQKIGGFGSFEDFKAIIVQSAQ